MHEALLLANALPCACAEFTRIQVGPFELPVGILTVLFASTALLLAPGMISGWVARRSEARAMARVLAPDGMR
ncbi:MAG: hypothetical protein Q8S73_24160 [Deltaproteobacteria bacterium]|nr:hypothetical protein [Myxococcales bacterium]MDP3217228.1 hypothetical protein [Deltaproteobacteria bacterium]